MLTEEQSYKMLADKSLDINIKSIPPVMIVIDGKKHFGTRDEAIKLGAIRDPDKPLTIRERITEKIRSWHGRRAVYHERRSIGLK